MKLDASELNVPIPVKGIKVAACSAGIYANKRLDLALIELHENTNCAAVFTRNIFCAAPVEIARSHLQLTSPRYCLINAGNANAGMGKQGVEDAITVCRNLSKLAGCNFKEIIPFSTGVIGEPLPVDKITRALPELFNNLSESSWMEVAKSIMTTDTRPKCISKKITIDSHEISITGIAKGSGMIQPNMATMLAYIATDASINKDLLNIILKEIVDVTFNRITVDGDTSTNDACLIMATGKSTAPEINLESVHYDIFLNELTEVCLFLAKEIVRDGEGATKFVSIEVSKGKNIDECKQIAYSIANSPLVKTALFASDANWGRILAAIGNAGISDINISSVSIYLDNICVVKHGKRSSDYTEKSGQKVMGKNEIRIHVELNRGNEQATIWTCDLSHDYVRINAEYRT